LERRIGRHQDLGTDVLDAEDQRRRQKEQHALGNAARRSGFGRGRTRRHAPAPGKKEQKQVARTRPSGPWMTLVRSEPYLAVAFRTAAAMAVRMPPPTSPETPCPTSAPASMPPAPESRSASPGMSAASQVPPTPPMAPAMV